MAADSVTTLPAARSSDDGARRLADSADPHTPDATTTVASPVVLSMSLGILCRGNGDPTYEQTADGSIWRGCLTPDGPGTVRVRRSGPLVEIDAWGEGATWLVKQGPEMIGAEDDLAGFAELVSDHPLLRDAHRRLPGLRIIRTGLVLQSLVPAILEQRVTTMEAYRAWRTLVRAHGSPAPGPAPDGLLVPPTPRAWALIPSWEWHAAGVDGKRSTAVMNAVRLAPALERTIGLPPGEAAKRLMTVPGIGEWTAAETMQRAHGCADFVSVGDYHLAKMIGYVFTGERNADDARMLELLAPYRPHRYRAARLALAYGPRRPRLAPRLAPCDHRQR